MKLTWEQLEQLFRSHVEPAIRAWVPNDGPQLELQLNFAMHRLREGRGVADFFRQTVGAGKQILDVGAGNGGVALGLAFSGDYSVTAIDIIPNSVFRAVREEAASPVKQIVASGHDLPFPSASFDIVTCLEVLEHIPNPRALGAEIMRVLRPGGVCMVMTPARVKWLFRPDPHFGIRGLLLLPDGLQEVVVARWLKRTNEYDVVHTFWTLFGMKRLFPGARKIQPMFNELWPYASHGIFYNLTWRLFRSLLWDRVLIEKRG